MALGIFSVYDPFLWSSNGHKMRNHLPWHKRAPCEWWVHILLPFHSGDTSFWDIKKVVFQSGCLKLGDSPFNLWESSLDASEDLIFNF